MLPRVECDLRGPMACALIDPKIKFIKPLLFLLDLRYIHTNGFEQKENYM